MRQLLATSLLLLCACVSRRSEADILSDPKTSPQIGFIVSLGSCKELLWVHTSKDYPEKIDAILGTIVRPGRQGEWLGGEDVILVMRGDKGEMIQPKDSAKLLNEQMISLFQRSVSGEIESARKQTSSVGFFALNLHVLWVVLPNSEGLDEIAFLEAYRLHKNLDGSLGYKIIDAEIIRFSRGKFSLPWRLR